jgi:uncharacterized repeat protein (TIGR01451 family)
MKGSIVDVYMSDNGTTDVLKEKSISNKFFLETLIVLFFLIFCMAFFSFSANAAPEGYCEEEYSNFHLATWITNVDYQFYPTNKDPQSMKITVDFVFTTDGFCLEGWGCQPDPDCNEDFRYVNAWIDWNGDYNFDPTEQVLDEELFWYDEAYQDWLIATYEGDPSDIWDIIMLPQQNFTGKSIKWYAFDSFAGGIGKMTVSKIITLPDDYENDTWMRVNYGWLYNPQDPCEVLEPTDADPYLNWEWGDASYKQISTTPDLCIDSSDIYIKQKKVNPKFPLHDFKDSTLTVTVHNNGKTKVDHVEVVLCKTDGNGTIISSETKTINSILAEDHVNITFEGNFDPYRFKDIIVEIDPENKIWETNESNNEAKTHRIEGYIYQSHDSLTELPKTRVDIQQQIGSNFQLVSSTFTDDSGFYKFWTNSEYFKQESQTIVMAVLEYSPKRQLESAIIVINETLYGNNDFPNQQIGNYKTSSEWNLQKDQDYTHDITFSGVEGGLAYYTLITAYQYHEKFKTAPLKVLVNINDDDCSGPYVVGNAIHLPPGKEGTTRPSAIAHEFTHIVENGWLPTYFGHNPLVPVEEGSCHWGSCISRNNPIYEFPSGISTDYIIIDVSNNTHTSNSTPAPATSAGCREEFQIAGTMWDLNETLVWKILRYGFNSVQHGFGSNLLPWPSTPLLFYTAYKELDSRSSLTLKAIFQSHAYITKDWPGKDGVDPDYFTDTFSDQGIDTDGNGKYDTLQVTVELNIPSSGTYILTGAMDSTNIGESNTTYLEAGLQQVNLSFFGEKIYESQTDGPYTLSFFLYYGNYTYLDTRLSFYDTNTYSYTNFDRPSILFTGNHFIDAIDDDGDGTNDQLIVDLELNLTESSYVKMYANLYCNDVFIDTCWAPNMYDDAVYEYIDAGVHNLNLYFNGESIHASGQNGTYELRTYLSGARTIEIGTFDYTDFETPPAALGDIIEEYTVDNDSNGFFDSLNINISVNGLGTYGFTGNLYNDTGAHILTTYQYKDINDTQSILLSFDGSSLCDQQRSGIYNLTVELYDMNGFFIGWKNYTLSSYEYTDFEPSSEEVFDITFNDYGVDNTGQFGNEMLCINMDITSLLSGNYQIEGYLSTDTGTLICSDIIKGYIDTSLTTHTLCFNGQQLGSALYNGNYTLDLVFINTSNIIELPRIFTTAEYTYASFESTYVVNTTDALYSTYGLENIPNKFGITIETYSTVPRYINIKAQLRDNLGNLIDETEIGYIWAFENDSSLLLFDGSKIYDYGIDGPYTLILDLYDENDIFLDSYTSVTEYYDHSVFALVTLTGTFSDYACDVDTNSLYDYLVINATVTVSTEGFCTISGVLEDNVGTTISTAENTVWLPKGTQTFPLYFDGTMIKNHGMNGPYALRLVSVYHNKDVSITDYRIDAFTTTPYNYNDFSLTGTIDQRPISIASGPTAGSTTDILQFNASASYDPEGHILTYNWDFGDGSTSTEERPIHSYSTDGVYIVNLTIHDGTQYSYPDSITVSIGYPVADAGGPYTVYGIQSLIFDGSDSVSPEGYGLTYHWEFGDGTLGSGMNPSHRYDNYGEYTITLTVNDGTYESTAKTTVTVLRSLSFDDQPTDSGFDMNADGLYDYLLMEVDVTNYVPQNISVEVTLTDSLDTVLSYGLNKQFLNMSSYRLSLYFDGPTLFENRIPGPYFVGIIIRDNESKILDSLNYTTTAYDYTEFQYNTKIDTVIDTGLDTNGNGSYDYLSVNVTLINYANRNITLQGTLFDSNGTSIDSNQETRSLTGNTTIQLLFDGPTIYSHGENGSYTVIIDLKNEYDHIIDSKINNTFAYHYTDFEEPLSVNLPPIAEANGAYRANSSVDIQFNCTGSYDPEGQELTYLWDFGDGNSSTEQNPIHAYNSTEREKFYPELNVSDGVHFDTDSATVYINYPVAISGGPYYATEGESITLDGSSSYDPLEESSQSYPLEYYWYPANGDYGTWSISSKKYASYDSEGEYHPYLQVRTNTGYPWYYSENSFTTVYVNDTDPIPDFISSQQSGLTPLIVEFTDMSDSYDGISLWEWDFDNDGNVDISGTDNAAQNPSFTYTTAGVYSVTLTLHEADGDTVSLVKSDYITVVETRPPITIYVPDDYLTIQEAIDAGNTIDGDTIIVRDGSYRQNIIVSKELTIKSQNGSYLCQLFPQYTDDHMISINSNNVTINGFYMNGTKYSYASICCDGFENITISNNWINDTRNGVIFKDVTNASILNNIIENCSTNPLYSDTISRVNIIGNTVSNSGDEGAEFSFMDNCTIKNNIAFGNRYSGILIRSGNDNVLVENILNGNGVPGHSSYQDCGLRILSGQNYLISNNIMNNNSEYGLFLVASFSTVHQNNMKENGNYDLYACSGNTITSNIGSADKPIIYADETIILENMEISSLILYDADYSVISNVTVSGSEVLKNNGIYAEKCDYLQLTNVTSNHNYFGLYMPSEKAGSVVLGQDNNTFMDCTFLNNSRAGIKTGGDGVKIEKCNIGFNEDYGIDFNGECSEHSLIVNSRIYNNSWSGIHLVVDFTIFNITNNTLKGNSWGIHCSEGDYVGYTSSIVMISDNRVIYNTDDGIHIDDTNREHHYKISNNTIYENYDSGLYLLVQYCNFDVVSNQIIGNDEGISCENTYWDENAHVNITYNTILENTDGISITKINDHPNNYYIKENIINNNSQTGIYINPISGNINIIHNSIIHNPVGISGLNSYTSGVDSEVIIDNNILSENNDAISISDNCNKHDYYTINNIINNNSMFGILLASFSGNIKIMNNMISCNTEGIYSENSNTYANITHNIISNNEKLGINTNQSDIQFLIYDNIIVNNTVNDIGYSKWNITNRTGQNIIGKPYLGGNYWSGYDGVDNTGDYLGDTEVPYNSSRGIVNGGDYHPLVLSQELYLIPINDLTMFTDTIRFIPLCSIGNNTTMINLSSASSLGFSVFMDQGNGIGTISFQPADSDVGEYLITINATDGINTVTESFNLNILSSDYLPISSFSYEPETPATLNPIYFNSTSTDPDGFIVNWTWDMGDGNTCYGENIQHYYTQGATYHVCLTVTDNHGFTDTSCEFIVVEAPYTDIGVNTILSPTDAESMGSLPIQVEIENFGNTDEIDIPLNVKINEITGEPATIFSENFSGLSTREIPMGWTNTSSNWGAYNSNYADGISSPEMRFYWSPSTVDTIRLYTYPIDTIGFSILNLNFKHYIDHYDEPYTLRVQTSTNGILWSDVWTIEPTSSIGPETIEISLTSADGVGSDTLYISWTFDGDSYNINEWYVDDIVLYSLPTSINVYNETVYVDLSSGESLIVDSFSDWTVMSEGNYSIECFVDLIGDVNSANNFIYKTIEINGTVSNQPPIADGGGPYSGLIGEDIQFDGSNSYDPDGIITSYDWDFDNDGQYDDASGVSPTYNWSSPGIYMISLNVLDDDGATDTNETTVIIQSQNHIPVANDDSYSINEDITLLVPEINGVLENDSDEDSDALSAILVQTATHGTLTLQENGSFLYTPFENYFGYDEFTYQANDSISLSNVATVNIAIYPINDAPKAFNDSYSVSEDSGESIFEVLTNDIDVEDDTLSITSITLSQNASVIIYGDAIRYTPDSDYCGIDSFTYTISDGFGGTDTATVTVTVTCIKDPPIAYDDYVTVIEGGTVTMLSDGNSSVLDNDTDVDGDILHATLVSGPSNAASFILNYDGTFSYTHDGSESYSDSFVYEADDNYEGTHQATVHITIISENDPPIAFDDNNLTMEDAEIVIDVLANDIDPESGSLTIISTTDPVNGSVINNGKNLTYIPDQDLCGTDTFSYTIEDDAGLTATAIVNLTITCVNDPPEAVNDSYVTQEDTTLFIAEPGILDNDVDVDSTSLSVILVQDTSYGALTLYENGSFLYEPYSSFEGFDSFSYQANDSMLLSSVATVNITVQSVQHPPVLQFISDQSVDENDTLTVHLFASDADGDSLDLNSSGLPDFASFTDYEDDTGLILFTPDFNDSGNYTITVMVSDGAFTDSTLFNVTVNNVNRPPYDPDDSDLINGTTDCSIETDLSWDGGDPDFNDHVTYDVYFGDTNPPGIIAHNISDTMYDLPILSPYTTYYWRIISWDIFSAKSIGALWSFTTGYTANITINKSVSLDNSSWCDTIEAEIGEIIYWNVTIENSGDVSLSDIQITDQLFDGSDNFSLSPGQQNIFYYTTIASFDLNNTVTVTAQDSSENTLTGTDWAEVTVRFSQFVDLELLKTASVSFDCNDEDEGLSHGFWKNHEEDWIGYHPEDLTRDIFVIPDELTVVNDTLYNALRFKGGKGVEGAGQLLMIQSVAALLNAAHPNISYPFTESEIISQVNSALASLDRETMLSFKDIFDEFNNLGGDIHEPCQNLVCTIVYTITVLNNGTMNATGVIVTDLLPNNLEFINCSADQGDYDVSTGIWTIGDILSGRQIVLTLIVETTVSGVYENTAEITHANEVDNDSIPNNQISAEDDQDTVVVEIAISDGYVS